MVRTIIRIKKIIIKKVRTKLGSINYFHRQVPTTIEETFYIILHNRQYKQKNHRCHERKTEPPL